ncbi:MAG TPA: Lrp/AsnC family transcriptional regulator [Gemmatimonadaceae bacterium]|nr:Lrp/AsnC family transcriptional regulator [Gemmatimonadaceae bacterium]
MIDDIDTKILNILQRDGRTTNADLARHVGLAPSAVLERVRKLEERGVLRGYTALVDQAAIGFGLLAFILVRSSDPTGTDHVARQIAKAPEVLEVHNVAGEDCFVVKVRARDTKDLSRILKKRFGAIKAIRSTRTIIVLDTIKESTVLPVAIPSGESDDG